MEHKIKRVLFGGAFDLLHVGHIRAIKRAKSYGYLILNVCSDKRLRLKKGNDRPIIPQNDRIQMLQALRYVDEVVCFNTAGFSLTRILRKVKPDIVITNTDNDTYDEECRKFGVDLIKLPRIVVSSKLDTTKIIQKIKGGQGDSSL